MKQFKLLFAGVISWTLLSLGAAAQDSSPLFTEHDPNSEVRLGYEALDQILSAAVMHYGRSERFQPRIRSGTTATRMSQGNPNPSWLEGNRVKFEVFEDRHINSFRRYSRGLQALPEQVGGLKNLNQNEQLAYWLNLYNLTVLTEVADRYPVVKLERFRNGRRNRGGTWDEKLIEVEGQELSLNDIQNRILIPNFTNPVVMYGLFQGAVGGPNLRQTAYTGANVWRNLRDNAGEFVNSIRGVHSDGDHANISRMYAWAAGFFPGGNEEILAHMYEFADVTTREILDGANSLQAEYFDWYVADIYAGRPRQTSMYAGNVIRPDNSGVRSREAELPDHVKAFVRAIELKFQTYGYPEGFVTIEEVETAEGDAGSADESEAGSGAE